MEGSKDLLTIFEFLLVNKEIPLFCLLFPFRFGVPSVELERIESIIKHELV